MCERLIGVIGYQERCNDVVYCKSENEAKTTVVYFGGDIQENMESHRDNKNYTDWCLDETSLLLHRTFPNSHIVVIRPSKMEYKTFSCYLNFVPSGNCGIPLHTPMHHSLEHLEQLLANLGKNLDNCDLILVGFSKGCVVLNQFLYEFNEIKEKTDFINRIKDMYWLDGGHSGGKNTWITSKPYLETLVKFGIQVHIHVSPYQIQDERRPWIRKEEKLFYNTLTSLKGQVTRYVHFEDVPPSITQHFNILNQLNVS